jgi:hypothetical protein
VLRSQSNPPECLVVWFADRSRSGFSAPLVVRSIKSCMVFGPYFPYKLGQLSSFNKNSGKHMLSPSLKKRSTATLDIQSRGLTRHSRLQKHYPLPLGLQRCWRRIIRVVAIIRVNVIAEYIWFSPQRVSLCTVTEDNTAFFDISSSRNSRLPTAPRIGFPL